MTNTAENNKRIAKNTMILYFRMLCTVGISFYTSRVILSNLGVSDFGLYNVIGGLVSMFYMITSTLSAAISRFLTYELGQKDLKNLRNTFSTSINIQLLISILIIILSETIGLWFINNKMNIVHDRIWAANWIYQFTMVSFIIEMISVPYNASIIAHEKMKAFAYVTIYSVIIKLGIALVLSISPIDKLIFYGILMTLMSLSTQFLYWWYCNRNFEECHYTFSINKEKFKQMFQFAGWSFFSSSSMMLCGQGVNILLNLFLGTPINAARGLAVQVDGTVKAFANNFTMAFSPQITKSYAQGDLEYTKDLVYKGSKYSFLLFFIISFPLIMETDFFLKIWLKEIPPYTSQFIQLTLAYTFIDILLKPSTTLNNATGNIKQYQILTGIAQFLVLPICYICLILKLPPYSVLFVRIILDCIFFPPRITLNNKYVNQTFKSYSKEVLLKITYVVLSAIITCAPIIIFIESSWYRIFITGVTSTITILVSSYLFAFSKNEKNIIKLILSKGYKKIFN